MRGAGFGPSIMKFTLTYDGDLRANGKPRQKWEIRKHLRPQIEELWRITPVLQVLNRFPWASLSQGFYEVEVHHSVLGQARQKPAYGEWIPLCDEITRGNRRFFPLIRNSLGLRCTLKIIFLRKEEPGGVYQGGDMDNRLKTLFDALSIPNPDQIIDDLTMDDPIYCLLEDDSLISGISIETHRLLSAPASSQHQVRLIIEVDIKVVQPRSYNHRFLGD